uniref:MMS19 nucleotide excision repair protein n=1 Tax=Rhabditophanes sp. KR3021 TaxID=114890 RepID=A0AC35UF94_9BILA
MTSNLATVFAKEWHGKVVVEKTETLESLVSGLGSELTSPDIDIRKDAVDKIFAFLKSIPNDFLSENEVGLLLEFFTAKIEEFAGSGSNAVEGVYYLLINMKNIPTDSEVPIFLNIFKDANLDMLIQRERTRMYELFAHLISTKAKVQSLKSIESSLIPSYISLAGGEKDPRCLIQSFDIFVKIVRNFDISAFAEEMFETIACYYPVEYNPPKNDTFNVTKEMLAVGCEKCLLSTKNFSAFLFNMISERFSEDEEFNTLEGKLEDAVLLGKGVKAFGIGSALVHLKDFFATFRSLTFHPSLKKCQRELSEQIRDVIKVLLNGLQSDSSSGKEFINKITADALENIEPFIVQAEMGMSGRGLDFILTIFKENKDEAIKEKILYWFGILFDGTTLQNRLNHEDVVEEILPYFEKFLVEFEGVDKETFSTLSKLRNLEVKMEGTIRRSQYSCETTLLKKGYGNDTANLVKRGLNDFDSMEKDEKHTFLKLLLVVAEKKEQLLVDEVKERGAEYESASSSFEPLLYFISNENNWNNFSGILSGNLQSNGLNGTISDAIIKWTQQAESTLVFKLLQLILDEIKGLGEKKGDKSKDVLAEMGYKLCQTMEKETAQLVGKKLSEDPQLVSFLMPLYVQYFMLLNEMNFEIPHLLTEDNCYKLGAITSHSDGTMAGEIFGNYENITTSIHLLKVLIFKNDPEALVALEKMFDAFDSSKITDGLKLTLLFNFTGIYNDPVLSRYKHTFLWKQRFLCQFVDMFVKKYSVTTQPSMYFTLLQPMLEFAASMDVPMNDQLLQMLPVITEALVQVDLEKESQEDESILALLKGLDKLLPIAPFEKVSKDIIEKLIRKILELIKGSSPAVTFQALVVAETFTKKVPALRIIYYSPEVFNTLAITSKSTKRAIRTASAKVRNLWELLPYQC